MYPQKRSWLVLLGTLLALFLAACQPGIVPVATVNCTSDFEATVHQGPNQGLALIGKLTFNLDSTGDLRGWLQTDDGQELKAVGQAQGRAISLMFNAGSQQYIFGTGTGEYPIHNCSGVWGGGFTGPTLGDSGDWLTQPGGRTIDPIDFTCGQELGNLCRCDGTADCVDLAEAGLCKDRITFEDPSTKKPTDDVGFCSFK
jgi:hypothetical protein